MIKEKKSVFQHFKEYIGHIWYDFRMSFKYNNMKLASWLVALPGIFLGFFLGFHANVVNAMSFIRGYWDPSNPAADADGIVTEVLLKPFDYSGLVLFLMILFGILNIFTAFTMSAKKSLGSVVLATVTSAFIVISGVLFFYVVFKYQSLLELGYANGGIDSDIAFVTTDYYLSLISVGIAVVASIVGCILGFVNYDRTYEKVDR